MSRRSDLEEHIRDAYAIILGYERIVLTSDRPEERQRAQREMDRQWAHVERLLAEYRKLASAPWADEIAELAAHFATATPADPPVKTTTGALDGKEMVYVPAGAFLYGKDKPERTLAAFWIDRTPVTNAEYARFVRATGRRVPRHWGGKAPLPAIADHPVVCVTWHDAETYARWAGKRLPSEEQWEKAARGTDGRAYPWGDGWRMGLCNTIESGIGGTTPVGRYSPAGDSPYGCADMAGNVWEWTASEYELGSGFPVLRGGSWAWDRSPAVVSARYYYFPDRSLDDYGLRCVSPIPPSER